MVKILYWNTEMHEDEDDKKLGFSSNMTSC